jgi:hypothetical protein
VCGVADVGPCVKHETSQKEEQKALRPISQDRAFGIATGYRLDDQKGLSSSPGSVKNSLFSMSFRPVLGSIQPPTPWVAVVKGPPLWSSGHSSWLQIRRPGYDSRHYQKKKGSGSGTGVTQPREYN